MVNGTEPMPILRDLPVADPHEPVELARESPNGPGSISTLTIVNVAVFAPMAKASDRTATAVCTGVLRSDRSA